MRLIDLESLGELEDLEYNYHPTEDGEPWYRADDVWRILENAPAVDAVPVVHGKWINPHFRNSYYCCNCSACSGEAMHMEFRWHKKGIYRICPNCGADMREAAHETN